MERLDRLLAHRGFGSRKLAKVLVRASRVTVAGIVATDPGMDVDVERQEITVDGAPLAHTRHLHLMLNKPADVVTAARDGRHQAVLELVPPAYRWRGLHAVGRLDLDTEGLLLLTTDGVLSHRLMAPRRHVEKVYRAELDGPVGPDDTAAFTAGLTLEDGSACLPARLQPLTGPVAEVTVVEGRFHQVKRMFAARGRRVQHLVRLQVGPLQLDPDLQPGALRPLNPEEVAALYAAVDLGPAT